MKKHILTLITLMLTLTVFGQAWKERKAELYASLAQKEFQLNEADTAKIKDLWLARADAFEVAGKKFKAGEITEAEKKDSEKNTAKTYNTQMAEILGISRTEFREFNIAAMEKVRGS